MDFNEREKVLAEASNLVSKQMKTCEESMGTDEFDNEMSRLDRLCKIYHECNDIHWEVYRWEKERNDRLEKERHDRNMDLAKHVSTLVIGTAFPVAVHGYEFAKGLEFETTGTITSMFFKSIIGKKTC